MSDLKTQVLEALDHNIGQSFTQLAIKLDASPGEVSDALSLLKKDGLVYALRPDKQAVTVLWYKTRYGGYCPPEAS